MGKGEENTSQSQRSLTAAQPKSAGEMLVSRRVDKNKEQLKELFYSFFYKTGEARGAK